MSRFTDTSVATTISSLQDKFEQIAEAQQGLLSREGETPNQMEADLDLNSFRVLNSAAPVQPTDLVRLQDLTAVEVTVDTDKLSVVDTPAAAILLDLQVGTYVQTKGYYSADGSGAATYLVVSNTYTPDNYGDFAMNNGNILELIKAPYQNAEQYGVRAQVDLTVYNGAAGTDQAAALQACMDANIVTVLPASTLGYRLGTTIQIPAGHKLMGTYSGQDNGQRGADIPEPFFGTVLVYRTTQIQMNGHSAIDGITVYKDNQNWNLAFDAGQPDGVAAWDDTLPALEYIGDNLGVEVTNMVTIGFTRFFRSIARVTQGDPNTNRNLEKPLFKNVRGYPLLRGIDIELSTDMVRFEDIHWNPTSMAGLPGFTATQAQSTKFIRNLKAFRLGRVDGGWMTRCFVYACKDFVDFSWPEPGEDLWTGGVSGSIRMTQCAADICHNFINMEATQIGFGVVADSCWAALNVWDIYDDETDAVITRRPSAFRAGTKADGLVDSGGNPRFRLASVEFVGCYWYGVADNTNFTGTDEAQCLYNFDTVDGELIQVGVTACVQGEHTNFTQSDTSTYKAALVSGLEDDKQNSIDFSRYNLRAVQTDTPAIITANYSSEGTTYARSHVRHEHFPGGSGTNTVPAYELVCRDSTISAAATPSIKMMYKDAASEIVYLEILRGTQPVLQVTGDREHLRLPLGLYNENHLVLGSESAGLHIWQNGTESRFKDGEPTAATDGHMFVGSNGTGGGTGSAGAGTQYIELTINGTTYKVLHDGTV